MIPLPPGVERVHVEVETFEDLTVCADLVLHLSPEWEGREEEVAAALRALLQAELAPPYASCPVCIERSKAHGPVACEEVADAR